MNTDTSSSPFFQGMPALIAGHDRGTYNGRWFYDLDSIIARARGEGGETEPDLARALLMYFCHCIERDSVPDARVMRYLADAFKEILSHGQSGDIGKALGVKRRKAGNPGDSAHRKKRSTRLTPDAREELCQEIKRRLSQKETHSTIKKALSVDYGISPDTVRNLIREIERADETQGGVNLRIESRRLDAFMPE